MLGFGLSVTVGPYVVSASLSLEAHPGVSAALSLDKGISLSAKALLVSFSFSASHS